MLTTSVSPPDAANLKLVSQLYGINATRAAICGVLSKRGVSYTCFLVGQFFCYFPCVSADQVDKASRKHQPKMLPICDTEGLSVRLDDENYQIIFESKSRTRKLHQKIFEAAEQSELFAWKASIARAAFMWSVAPIPVRLKQQSSLGTLTYSEKTLLAIMQNIVRTQVTLSVLQVCGDLAMLGKPLVGGWVRGFSWNDSLTLRYGDSRTMVYPRDVVTRAALNSAATVMLSLSEKLVADQVNTVIDKACFPYSRRAHNHLEEIMNVDEIKQKTGTDGAYSGTEAGAIWASWVSTSVKCTRMFAEATMKKGPDLVNEFWPSAPDDMLMRTAIRGWLSTVPLAPVSTLMRIAQEYLAPRLKIPARTEKTSLSGLRGVHNMGNSCYLNATLQCLAHTPAFPRFFLTNSHLLYVPSSISRDNPLAAALAQFMAQLWKYTPEDDSENAMPVLNADDVFTALNADCKSAGIPTFAPQTQQDAHEALVQLLDRLGEELGGRADGVNRRGRPTSYSLRHKRGVNDSLAKSADATAGDKVKELPSYTSDTLSEAQLIDSWHRDYVEHNPHFLSKSFAGQTVQTLECPECHARSYCCDSFTYLFMSFPDSDAAPCADDSSTCSAPDTVLSCVSVEACLEKTFSDESIDMGGGKCGACGEVMSSPALRRIALSRIPPCLILCVNRTLIDDRGAVTGKRQTPLKVRPWLALGPWLFTSDEASHVAIMSAGGVESLAALDEAPARRGGYQLYGVVLHHGAELGKGHYTAGCWVADTWWYFDDAKVTRINNFDKWISDCAKEIYILFYRTLAPEY